MKKATALLLTALLLFGLMAGCGTPAAPASTAPESTSTEGWKPTQSVELVIPYDKGAVLSLIHQKGQVEAEEYTETGTKVTCLLDAALYQRVLKQLGREV